MWIKELFGVDKPIIAMCHLQPMPGDPHYDAQGGMDKVVEYARRDLHALQDGGVDGVMFSNEFSMPYLTKVLPETVAAMSRVIGELKSEIKIPHGANCLWDPIASLDVAAATSAYYIREIMSGVYASDFGLWDTNAGATARHRKRICADNIKLLFNIVPEAAVYLAERDIVKVAQSTVFNHGPDALCVSGLTAGVATDTQILSNVKKAVGDTPIFCNTGCNKDNIAIQLAASDGAVVATTFKVEGKFKNPVDKKRVAEFMDAVKQTR